MSNVAGNKEAVAICLESLIPWETTAIHNTPRTLNSHVFAPGLWFHEYTAKFDEGVDVNKHDKQTFGVNTGEDTWDICLSELEDSFAEMTRLYKEEFGREFDEESEEDFEHKTVEKTVPAPVMQEDIVLLEKTIPQKSVQQHCAEHKSEFPAPSRRDVFALNSPLHNEMRVEAAMAIQDLWKRQKRKREFNLFREGVNKFVSSVLNGRRDCEIPESAGISNRTWHKYGNIAMVFLICEVQALWEQPTLVPKSEDIDKAAVSLWTLWSQMWAKLWSIAKQAYSQLQRVMPFDEVLPIQSLIIPCCRASLQLTRTHLQAIRKGKQVEEKDTQMQIMQSAMASLAKLEPRWRQTLDKMELDRRIGLHS